MMMKRLNEDQCKRLIEFAVENGKGWQQKLLDLWMSGKDASERDGHLLRQVRNVIGPSGLLKLKMEM